MSRGAAERIQNIYVPFAQRLKLPVADLWPYPSEAAIVSASLRYHSERLLGELESATPEEIVTLGNAALRVMRSLGNAADGDVPIRLSDRPEQYGRTFAAQLATGRRVSWLPRLYLRPHRATRLPTISGWHDGPESAHGSIHGSPHIPPRSGTSAANHATIVAGVHENLDAWSSAARGGTAAIITTSGCRCRRAGQSCCSQRCRCFRNQPRSRCAARWPARTASICSAKSLPVSRAGTRTRIAAAFDARATSMPGSRYVATRACRSASHSGEPPSWKINTPSWEFVD